MTPRQRKLFLLVAVRQAEKKPALVQDLMRMAALADMTVYQELYKMRDMELVYLDKTERGSASFTEVSLTPKGERLLPRVKEVQKESAEALG